MFNATFSIDGGLPQLSQSAGCSPFCYNTSVYNIQSLKYGDHLLEIANCDFNNGLSHFDFDYADVNDTTPSPNGTIIHPNRSSQYVLFHSSRSLIPDIVCSKVAVAVGSTIGGLAAIAFAALILVYLWKKSRSRMGTVITPERNPNSFTIDSPSPRPDMSHRISSASLLPVRSDAYGYNPNTPPAFMHIPNIQPQITPPPVPSVSTHAAPASHDSEPSNIPTVAEAGSTARDLSTPTQVPEAGGASGPRPGLTEMQAKSISLLLKQNVPGPVVASVMESMLNSEGSSAGGA